MDRDTYLTIQTQIATFTGFAMALSDDDLKEFIQAGQLSLAVAPVLDPTLHMMAGKKLEGIMGLARALRDFQAAAKKYIAAIEQGDRTAQALRALGADR